MKTTKKYSSKEISCKFAEWIDKRMRDNVLDRWRDTRSKNFDKWIITNKIKPTYHTTEELLEKFILEEGLNK